MINSLPLILPLGNKCINILEENLQSMDEEAEEYFNYNVQGSYVGEKTPIFLIPFS